MKAKEYIQDITQCLNLSREWAEAELAAREGVMSMTFTDYQTEVNTRLNRLQSVDINPLLLELKEHSRKRIRAMCVSLSRMKLSIRVNPHTYEYVDEIPMQYWNEPWAEAYNSTWRLVADFVMGIIDECGFGGFNDLFPSSSEEFAKIRRKDGNNKEASFNNIIQYPDKEKLLKRLHALIDGNGGADVGAVLLKAKKEKYLTKCPTENEYKSEFNLIGSWAAIKKYLNTNTPTAEGNADNIVIF